MIQVKKQLGIATVQQVYSKMRNMWVDTKSIKGETGLSLYFIYTCVRCVFVSTAFYVSGLLWKFLVGVSPSVFSWLMWPTWREKCGAHLLQNLRRRCLKGSIFFFFFCRSVKNSEGVWKKNLCCKVILAFLFLFSMLSSRSFVIRCIQCFLLFLSRGRKGGDYHEITHTDSLQTGRSWASFLIGLVDLIGFCRERTLSFWCASWFVP